MAAAQRSIQMIRILSRIFTFGSLERVTAQWKWEEMPTLGSARNKLVSVEEFV